MYNPDEECKEISKRYMNGKKFELEEITLTPENCKRYITFVTDNELQQIVDQNRTNLRGLIPSMLLINDFAYQWNNNQKLFDKMFHDNPPKPGDDLEKWMKDNADGPAPVIINIIMSISRNIIHMKG